MLYKQFFGDPSQASEAVGYFILLSYYYFPDSGDIRVLILDMCRETGMFDKVKRTDR
jgi:hypothetical protein